MIEFTVKNTVKFNHTNGKAGAQVGARLSGRPRAIVHSFGWCRPSFGRTPNEQGGGSQNEKHSPGTPGQALSDFGTETTY
jgi:ribosomal protein S14